jgi:flagellar protein FliJ
VKPFRFRGERLLAWRRRQADAARAAFVRARESARETAARSTAGEASVAHAERELRAATGAALDVTAIVRHWNWIESERKRTAVLSAERDRACREAEAAAALLQAAARHVKVMERLRERAWQRYLMNERTAEMKAVNERATELYVRRRTAETR